MFYNVFLMLKINLKKVINFAKWKLIQHIIFSPILNKNLFMKIYLPNWFRYNQENIFSSHEYYQYSTLQYLLIILIKTMKKKYLVPEL